ncbi:MULTISPECIES: CPBP family intramembrane glutamic endopeptidase [Paenibacillus]|uniref:CPBP family intramembrane glutamic endopeptidase n=1 Tax=Paenibacillus residui TaxID=629724 RepID=A0ABW3D7E7_9BACL|nr:MULTISPECIES: CPBP family intramembrane glutamic endopeptidase [Paenibacillaceae]
MTGLKYDKSNEAHSYRTEGKERRFLPEVLLSGSFVLMIIFTQLEGGRPYLAGLAVLLAAALPRINQRYYPLHTTILGYMAGFLLYRVFNHWLESLALGQESTVLLNRLSLLLLVAPMVLLSLWFREKPIPYLNKPDLRTKLFFPWIDSGFHQVSVKMFLMLAILINLLVFAPFVMQRTAFLDLSFVLIAISFAVINSFLEEVIWRGVLLRRFGETIGAKPALLVTSLGFGLQHYSLGFDWWICLLFAGGGIFYGAVVLRSGSLYPAILWHGVINLLMVFSGMIL